MGGDDTEVQAAGAGVLRALCVDDEAASKAVDAGALPHLQVGGSTLHAYPKKQTCHSAVQYNTNRACCNAVTRMHSWLPSTP